MYKLVIVLFTLNSALVSDSLILQDYNRNYNQPVATSYTTREDTPGPGDNYGYGYSKKSGYNKMIITTYISPVPEEVAASYSSYVIHPVNGPDNKRCDYNRLQSQPSPELYKRAPERNAQVSTFLQMFPIIVAEPGEKLEPEEEPTNKLGRIIVEDDNAINEEDDNVINEEDDNANNEEDKDSIRAWFFKEEPTDENVIWLLKKEPKATTAGYWKSFEKQFDTFYKDEFNQLFGDFNRDDESDEEDENDKESDEVNYWEPDYEYEDERDKNRNKWKNSDVYGPKYIPGNNYKVNDYDYGYDWPQAW